MLVIFRSKATDSITMFQNVAVEMLKLMGATGRVPGGLSAEDVPAALTRLESAVEGMKATAHEQTAARPADNEDWASEDDKDLDRQAPVGASARAVPLLSLLKRAAAANAAVTWEKQ